MVELSELLFFVASQLDGVRQPEEIADIACDRFKRPLDADGVTFLIDEKLRPLHLLDEGPELDVAELHHRHRSLLGLQVRVGVVPESAVRALSGALASLFATPVMAAALGTFIGVDTWLLAERRPVVSQVLSQGARLLYRPDLLLVVIGLTVVAGAFHELGHAAACRYGGARPGRIGVGIYLLWPVFYNDLRDSYRLSRGGRLRADIGGIYFNAVAVVVLTTTFLSTGYTPLLVAAMVQHLVIVQQLLPFVRLDGYYLVSDLAGEPDLFGRIRTTIPWRNNGGGATTAGKLTPWAQVVVTAWMVITVPLLLAAVVFLGISAPHLLRDGRIIATFDLRGLRAALERNDVAGAVLSGIQLLILSIPVVGISLPLLRALVLGVHQGEASLSDETAAAVVAGVAVAIILLGAARIAQPG